jgi:hypothetical protein
MNKIIKNSFYKEFGRGKDFYRKELYVKAFSCFERAHIIGQKYVIPHTLSHIWMLRIGLRTRNLHEIFGQLLRIPAGILGSAIGFVPVGNTGGANVKALKTMPIPEDLQEILNSK